MKKNKLLLALVAFFVLGLTNISFAQYDDLYYNPDTDAGYYYSSNSSSSDSYASNDRNDNGYDDEVYEDYNDYDDYNYYYSSRIRRFHRPYYGFSYFDPVYVDQVYYDPFWTPGVTLLIYDSYNPWRSRYNRFNYGYSWNSWGGSRFFISNSYGSPWGWNNGYYGGGYGNTYVTNNYYGNGYGGYGGGYGNYGGGGYSNYYCPPSWGNGNSYNTVSYNNPVNNRYYGSRKSGSSGTSDARINGASGRRGISNGNEATQATRPNNDATNREAERNSLRRELNETRTNENRRPSETDRSTVSPSDRSTPRTDRNVEETRPSRGSDTRQAPTRNRTEVTPRDNSNKRSTPSPRIENNSRSRGGGFDNNRSSTPQRSTPAPRMDNNSRSSSPSVSPRSNGGGSNNTGSSSRSSGGGSKRGGKG
ncbi:MAG: hypothetical protein K9J37_04270 [Saprospiraceae bacterium]|nr:hypothetical protein [Saprospiraceae bacterium]MCF8249101.1 hypothetical protein [Saprospiraceae bacterium]MCF8282906.1 hypothetical protein [Bacteroidales bacterium]MCF8311123.1 hypothetical protein [Saprospiraceae bacterium]MCF8440213.1 hypothetical protein [Saprospiraceae bacterium]